MSTPGESAPEPPQNTPETSQPDAVPASEAPTSAETPPQAPLGNSYSEVSPGVPRYGQYAPPGYQPPSVPADANANPPTAPIGQPYQGQQQYPGQPYQGQPYQGQQQYPGQPYQGQPYQGQQQYPGQPYQGQQQYPGYVTQPPAPAPVSRPTSVLIASILIFISGGLQALGVITITFLLSNGDFRNTLIDQMEQQGLSEALDEANLDAATFDQLLGSVGVIAIIIAALFTALYFVIGYGILKGKRWALITGTVFAALSVPLMILAGLSGILQFAPGIVAIVLCWLQQNRSYFR